MAAIMNPVQVIGAGLAGCEAAWQLAARGVPVKLYEMKPTQMTPAHHLSTLAELVCSNSLRSARLVNAVGLLKEEMRRLGSLIMTCADATAIPAGGALAVDRESFSSLVTRFIQEEPLIELIPKRIDDLPDGGLTIIATGPLTDGTLFQNIKRRLELETLHFFDAAAPIIYADSLDNTIVFRQSRYGHGGDDYLNCPMNETEYQGFWQELVQAERAVVHDFDRETVFEGCMPIETMAGRGQDTMRFGPLKPVGLIDPRTGREPYACVQLRQDNRAASLYNLVGFQTRLTIAEQKRVFRLIPGLQKVEFARFGVMHRNTYLPSPQVLQQDYSVRQQPELYFAGQMTGVEGYVESASSGLIAGWQAACQASGQTSEQRLSLVPSAQTIIGSLARYVSDAKVKHFQPMNANFGLAADLTERYRRKELKLQALAERSLAEIDRIAQVSPDIAEIRLQLFHKADRFDLSQIPQNVI